MLMRYWQLITKKRQHVMFFDPRSNAMSRKYDHNPSNETSDLLVSPIQSILHIRRGDWV